MQIKVSEWSVIYEKQIKLLNQITMKPIGPNILEHTQHNEQSLIQGMPQNKITEAASLTNYLAIEFQPNISAKLNLMAETLGASKSLIVYKLGSLGLKASTQQGVNRQLMRTCRKKITLCFSSKWREPQKILFVLIHNFVSNQKDVNRTRIHIINQRGLILQTLSNIDQNKYLQEISTLVKRHYHRLDQIVVLSPQQNTINLNLFEQFFHALKDYSVAIVNYKRSTFTQLITNPQSLQFEYYELLLKFNHIVSFTSDRQILIWHSKRMLGNKLFGLLKTISQIIKREFHLVSFFSKYNYMSSSFNQKQIILRLFAYYFNFITLKLMIPQTKDDLLRQAVDSELKISQSTNQTLPPSAPQSQPHTFITHSHSLYCPVCTKRTKIRCQKCCLNFNKYFGLCENQCFQLFHSDMSPYIDSISKKKTYKMIYKEDNNLQDQQFPQKTLFGKKKVKTEEPNEQKNVKNASLKCIEDIKNKWKSQLVNQDKHYQKLANYGAVGLISPGILKRVQYLRYKLAELAAHPSKQPPIKHEQSAPPNT